MHSRKSIFYRGIVFIVALFAMAIFSTIGVKAEETCKVALADNATYLTFGGGNSNWFDLELKIDDSCTSEERATYSKLGVYVNGSQVHSFYPSDYGAGHYTVEYRYKFLGAEESIYRYVRVLDSNFDTSKNYSLGVFNAFPMDENDKVDAQVVNAFYDSDSQNVINFVVSNKSTYVVLTNLVGKELARHEVAYYIGPDKKNLNLEDVVRVGNDYYLIGNIDMSDSSVSGVIKTITIVGNTVSESITLLKDKAGVTYNSGYVVTANEIYLVGKTEAGYPVIDKFTGSNIENVHIHGSARGEYSGILVKDGYIYAVGYEMSSTSTSKGLYTYLKTDRSMVPQNVQLFEEDAKFTKIIANGSANNIIIGETHALQISAGGTISAINTRAGYSDALVLEIDNVGLAKIHAGLYGTSTNDTFTSITHLGGTKYALTGTANDGSTSLAYVINVTNFETTEELVSKNSDYSVNGAINTPYGTSYYGAILKNNIQVMGIHYLKRVTVKDPMLLLLDNRGFRNEYDGTLTNETINLVRVDTPTEAHYKYCYYSIAFNGVNKTPTECTGSDDYIPSSVITPEGGSGARLEYRIDTETGATIIIYRTVVITDAPVPVNLSTNKTGILKWYTYNRSYTYVTSTAVRLSPDGTTLELTQNGITTRVDYNFDFSYYFTGSAYASADIYDMIQYYFDAGNTTNYNMAYIDPAHASAKTFEHSNQLSAAFASIEYAKMFAYYQEFSRVVRVEGSTPRRVLGASLYPGQDIQDGQDYYIYYIDYIGNSSTSNAVDSCRVTTTSITNCSGRAGYAFESLSAVNTVIKNFLIYNNYFVGTRNTIYNGSIPASEVEEYKQDLYTKEYLTSYQETVRTATMNLTFNVHEINSDGTTTEIYSGVRKGVYFGGQYISSYLDDDGVTTVYSYKFNGTTHTKLKAKKDAGEQYILYYYNDASVFIGKNACYEVYYSFGTGPDFVKGSSKVFCLDNTAPVISYHVENAEYGVNASHTSSSPNGNSVDTPAYIARDFSIVEIIDTDDYAYIMVNKVVYPMTCNDNSMTCLESVSRYINQTFRYNKNNPTKVNSISFADRSGNSITFYFVIGTTFPTLTVTDLVQENKGDDQNPELVTTSFGLTINFYETNSIRDFMITSLSRQNCSVVHSSDPCYNEENDDTIYARDSNAAQEFSEMVTNYIYAVSYRDRANLEGQIVLTPDAEGLYINPINNYVYKIENGKFVEVAGYEEKMYLKDVTYTQDGEVFILENNFFVKGGVIYYYEDSVIQAKKMQIGHNLISVKPDDWDSHYGEYYKYDTDLERYVLNSDATFVSGQFYERSITFINEGPQIVVSNNNQFKFNPSDKRLYQIVVSQEEGTYIESLPISYQIETDNTFRIDYTDGNGRIIYTYNPNNGLIEYANPLILTSKRIELVFTRTTKTMKGEVSGGVDVPYTLPKYKEGTNIIDVDPLTGLQIYTIDESRGSRHFNIVDGIYAFNITQGLDFGTLKPVTGSINVTKLDLRIGYAIDHPGILTPTDGNYAFEGISGRPFDFTGTSPDATQLRAFDNNYVYPLSSSQIASLSGYEKTYFSPNSVFVGFTVKPGIVFTIKAYQVKSVYGLPYANNVCKEIVILGGGYSTTDDIPTTASCTSPQRTVMYLPGESGQYGIMDPALLKQYGIYDVLSGDGGYIFSGENTFYEISVVEKKNTASGYVNASDVLSETFYIDGSFDESTLDAKVTQVGTGAQGEQVFNKDGLYEFKDVGGEYFLHKNNVIEDATIGGKSLVHFDLNYYTAQSADDTKENRLLLMHLIVDGTPHTCNVYKAITDNTYASECTDGYVNSTLSADAAAEGVSRLIFSESGNYKVIFEDASSHQVTYNFVIDKSAPVISLESVDDDPSKYSTGALGDEYQVIGYTKDPRLTILIEDDLSYVTTYCYKFIYGENVSTTEYCPTIANQDYVLTTNIQMSATSMGLTLIQALQDLSYDGNVILSISARDALGNETVKRTEINFWADYSAPTFEEKGSFNVNKQYVEKDDIDNNDARPRTITVTSNDYVGQTIICDSSMFSFKDPRYISDSPAYTYQLKCTDTHNNTTDPIVAAFPNTITMVFYEVDEGTMTIKMDGPNPVPFQFGVPTTGGNARWIYVTIQDYVGNIAPNGQFLPIIVEDGISPFVVEGGVKKCVAEDQQNCDEWEILPSHDYVLKNESSPSTVFLSNSNVSVTFSEFISEVKSCVVYKYDKNGDPLTGECDHVSGSEYEYNQEMRTFIFETSNLDLNTFKIIKFVVTDFAGRESGEVVIVIDRINPEISFFENRGDPTNIEYATTNSVFDDSYNYRGDLNILDDQGASNTVVNHSFYRYAPLLTYKNYKKDDQGKYEKVSDYQLRETGVTYYLLIDSKSVNDKQCINQKDGNSQYCYVIDTQNTYYFSNLLDKNTINDIQVWTNMGLDLKPINRIDGNTGIAVYKVAYQVQDFAGNVSNILYKQVFVMDTRTPDLTIKDDRDNVLFTDVASSNPDHFTGKINTAVTFVATDSPTSITYDAKVLFYKCGIQEYTNNPQGCAISQDLLFNPAGNMFGQYNSYAFRRNAENAVYKAFIYDSGQYVEEKNFLFEDSTSLFVLEKNIATVYFVINRDKVDATYIIHGNKYNGDYIDRLLSFDEKEQNYIEIMDGENSSDVTLMSYNSSTLLYDDVSKSNAIGFDGYISYVEDEESGKKIVTVYYKDDQGRTVYEIRYKQADLTKGFMVHESYYYLEGADAEACVVGKGESRCEDHEDKTFIIVNVTARIYEDGVYESLVLQDSFGNRSEILANALVVDNTPYTTNLENNSPTGVNYWFSVPKSVITVDTVAYYNELKVPKYNPLPLQPSDWEAEYTKYYVKDGENYIANTDPVFEPLKFYSIDYELASDVNVLEAKYTGNFNSNYFYAIASYEEAKVYMYNLYRDAVTAQISRGFNFYDAYGKATYFSSETPVDTIMQTILGNIYSMIIPTFTADRKFGDTELAQTLYTGAGVSSTMYQYTYLLRTKKVTNGVISYEYSLAGDICSAGANQECIKVNLRIISSVNDTVEIALDTNEHTVTCVSSGLGWGGSQSNSGCTNPQFAPGQEATIVFIDQDNTNPHHTNVVYFGVRVYSETTSLDYVEIGNYIPLQKIQRFDNDQNLNSHGDYIWVNSEWWRLSEIENTNLYKNSCEFKGETFNTGCVFVTYFSTYEFVRSQYKPSVTGQFYYDYYRDDYFDNKEDLINSVNQYSDKDIEFTYSDEWNLCTAQGYSCPLIPVFATGKTVANLELKNQTNNEAYKYQNKKTHIELFNSKNGEISRLFEVKTTVKAGKFSEVYSYATFAITTNNATKFYNINRSIIKVDGYSPVNSKPEDWDYTFSLFYTKVGKNYVQNTSNTWVSGKYYIHDAFACIIDVEVESINKLSITDSAGNQVVFNISHTDATPKINYSTMDSNTNSNVLIGISTESKVTGLSNDYVSIYKYDLDRNEYDLISTGSGSVCYSMLTSTTGVLPSSIEFRFNYHADYNCAGVYKIEIKDNFENRSFKEFIFNPYVIDNKLATTEEGYSNNVHIYGDTNIIANEFFTINVNSGLNYINVYKYPAYSNLTLDAVADSDITKVVISNFASAREVLIGQCTLSISNKGNGIYSITALNDATHSCDGVYKVEVVNLFSDKITRFAQFAGLEGGNAMEMTSEKPEDWEINYNKYYYLDEEGNYIQVRGSATSWEANKYYEQKVIVGFATNIVGGYTIELDSTAPDSSLLGGDEQNFNLYLDDNEYASVEDTKELISSQAKSIEYVNTFVTVAWGGYASYSFASLAYRIKSPTDATMPESWTYVSENVDYTVPFRATHKFAPTIAGEHIIEFKFVDAVRNENSEATYTIKIRINPPEVGLFEVIVDPITGTPSIDVNNEIKVGKQYAFGERIPVQAILKCTADVVRDCRLGQYTYSLVVNNTDYSSSYNKNQAAISDPISQSSPLFYHSEDRFAEELKIELKVSILGKPEIATLLYVIIDSKAPVITIEGTTATGTTTYVNSVIISLDQEDKTNIASIYKCDAVIDDACKSRLPNGSLIDGGELYATIEEGVFSYTFTPLDSGYFMVKATDDPVNLGNESMMWFALDNEAPTISVTNGLNIIAPYMYTNANSIKANVIDELSELNSRIEVEYEALLEEDKPYEATMTYDAILGLTKEGKYTLTPYDGVGHKGESITFYIYRQTPNYALSGDNQSVRKDVVLSWTLPDSEMKAPIVSVTLDGDMYKATFNEEEKKYNGALVTDFGEHTFVIVDSAGNRAVIMVTINPSSSVCINGNSVNVRRQYNYSINSLIIGGKDEGFHYQKGDVIIFALPSQADGQDCVSNGLLGYRTLDPENSHFLVSSDSNASRLSNNQFDFVAQGFISKSAIAEVNNIGGNVVVFVVTKDIANNVLGYKVGTNFFMEDPLGWTMIFITAILAFVPGYRIFVKKKVRVI